MNAMATTSHGSRNARRSQPSTRSARKWTRELKLRMFRRLVPEPASGSNDVVVALAVTDEERAAAFRLVHDEYVRSGLSNSFFDGVVNWKPVHF